MSRAQRISIFIGAVAAVVIGLVPPWTYIIWLEHRIYRSAGYSLLFHPPPTTNRVLALINEEHDSDSYFSTDEYKHAVRETILKGHTVEQIAAARPNWSWEAIEAEAEWVKKLDDDCHYVNVRLDTDKLVVQLVTVLLATTGIVLTLQKRR